MYRLLGVPAGFLLLFVRVGPNRRHVDVHGVRGCPVWFGYVADIAPSRESQLSVKHPAHDGAVDQDAYGLVRGISLYRSER